jgi:glycosyltransferase involved in cell wall biosynthesis
MRVADPKPSVLHIFKDYYPPVVGGIEKCIHWMCDALRDDYFVRVLVAARSRRTTDEVVDGVRVVSVGCYGRVLSLPLAPGFPGWLRRLDSQILHFHLPMPASEMSYLLARPKGKVVVTYHSDIVRRAQRLTGYGALQQVFLKKADAILPTSQRYLDSSAALAPHRERCRVMPLGIPIGNYDETDASRAYSARIREMARGRLAIVFVGVLRYYKGLTFLIEALRGLPETVCVFLGGDAPLDRPIERTTLERQVAESGLGHRVFFLGKLGDSEVTGLLRAGDIYCLPSHLRSEAFGLSQIEALACGLPVVCTNLDTGVPEVNADGVTGIVVEPANPEALRHALASLIDHPELRTQYGEAGRRRAEALYSVEAMGRNLRDVYGRLLGS